MIVLLLLLHYVLGNGIFRNWWDTPKNKYIMDNIDTCPDIGYYFKRESNLNALDDSCYLCFCQNNGTAVCWPRDNRRCDKKYYYHAGRRKRDSRARRSPGFTDIFFRDAAREVFNRQLPEQCKPHESSFSEGCPPADWCVGCTVCDCDANGRWDCHILSFCSDNKGKKQVKKRKSSLRNKITKRQLTTKIPTSANAKKSNKKPSKVNTNKTQKTKQSPPKQYKKQINSKNKKKVEMQKKKSPLNKSKVYPQKKAFSTKKNTPINKKSLQQNKKPNKPKNINTKNKKYKNDTTAMIADTIFKKVMASVEKILYETQKNASIAKNNKVIQKRSMSKQVYKNKEGKMKSGTMNKMNKKQWINKVIENKRNEKLGRHLRRKREVSLDDSIQNITQKENFTTFEPITKQIDLLEKKFNIKNEFVLLNGTSDKIDKLNYFHYKVDDNNVKEENNFKITKLNEIYAHTITTTEGTKSLNHDNKFSTDRVNQKSSSVLNYNESLQDIVDKSEKTKQNFIGDISKKNITCGKICEFKKFWKKNIFNFRTNSSTAEPIKNKKNNILDKIKMFLGKIFKKEPNRGNKTKIDKNYPLRKHNFVKILCKSIDSCKYNATDKLLHSKFNQLKVESNKIIKSVKIIKGLLKLLNFDKMYIIDKLNIGKKFRNNDEKILTAILKNEYEAYLCNLTETQRIQIRYVKENTLIFIQSVENFANVLSDLVDILSKKYNRKKSLSRRYHRCLKTPQNTANNKEPISQKLEKIKNLLIRYNLVQNKFMKQMYNAIAALNSTKNTAKIKKISKVSYKNENKTNPVSTDIYIENIIKNLRKLKDLAQKLSSKSRRKRSALDDDHAIEYLLTLMEYILKQNRPLDVAPAKDGIDLIIEAIKNAPDVKSVKKKVLDYTSTTEATTKSLDEEHTRTKSNKIKDIDKFRTFESIDKESEMMMESHLNDMKYNTKDIDKNVAVEIKNDLNNDINYNTNKINNPIETKQKFEVFFDDDDDFTVENVTKINIKDAETSANTESSMLPTRTLRPLDKNSDEGNGRVKLDWIDENFSNEKQVVETTTEKILQITRTIKQKEKFANAVSSMTEESAERNEKLTAGSDEVYKRQMNLFNSLDYGTEKSQLDSNSKEDKYNVETFPMYFA